MSVYLLATSRSATDCERDVVPLYTQAGFQVRARHDLGSYDLWLLDNPGVSALTTVTTSDGRFAAALGAFVYEGRTGEDALKRYLNDFPRKTDDLWASTRGHFTLILHQQGQTTVLCDGLGAHKVYHLPAYTLVSNAFLAALAGCASPSLDRHGVYAYAWNGACFGGRTFVKEVQSLPANAVLHVGDDPEPVQKPSPILAQVEADDAPDDAVAHNLEALLNCTGDLAAAYAGDFAVSFSGGYDSRLLLAALIAHGRTPALFVYGQAEDTDVQVAESVAEAAGLSLDRIDKRAEPPVGAAFARVVARDLVVFDGWKNEGLIDVGTDYPDRLARHKGGRIPFNGGLGEIYRNFYNLRNTDYTADRIVDCFYRQYRPAWATDAFDERAYIETLAAQMRAQLNTARERLSADQAQLLYALFRGRFWTAREAEINQRFGCMHFPFLEPACVAASARIPVAARHFGWAQREMIRRLDARLAMLPSSYGFAFSQRPTVRYRANVLASLARPARLRPALARARQRRESRPAHLDSDRLGEIIDPTFPHMTRFFRVDRIDDADTLNRVATLEYLATRFGLT